MGLFVILEVLFSPGAQIFQSRPPQRKESKALSFFKHLRIPFNFRKCFPSSGQQKHHPAHGPFLHILTTPSLFLLPQRVNFRSIRLPLSPDSVSGESKNSFLLISPHLFFGCFFPQEVSFKGFWLSDLNVSLEPNICIVLAWLSDNPGKGDGKVQNRDTALRTVWVPFSKRYV